MPDEEKPALWHPTPEPPKVDREPFIGIGIVAASDLAAAGLLWLWILVPTSDLYGHLLPTLVLYNIPFAQWAWITPLYGLLREKHRVRSKAMLITASVITLLGAACWGVLAFGR